MLNTIAVMGRLTSNPELRKTSSGISTTSFTIACDRNYVKSGEERKTDFFDVVSWRSAAEFACKYFQKGQLIAVNGSLQTRSYEDKQGNKRKVYEIVADNLHFAETKQRTERPNSTDESRLDINPSGTNDEPVQGSFAVGAAEDFAVIDESEDLPF